MEPMTRLERFRAFVAREPTDRPRRYAKFTPGVRADLEARLDGRTDEDYFDMDRGVRLGLEPPEGYEPPDFTPYFEDIKLDERVTITALGVARRRGDFHHFERRIAPLRNASSLGEIEAFPLATKADWREDHMAARVEECHANGQFVLVGGLSLYEIAWQIRGYEQFLTDMIERPEWSDSILDRLTERSIRTAEAAARAGVALLQAGDDVGNQRALMFSPQMWRRMIKPRWARIFGAARAIKPDIVAWYHSDGNIEAIIDDMIEVGLNILNPMQPECMDVERIYREYGDRLLFDGSIGTQSVMPWGSPDDVREMVRRRRELFGGSLTLAPTHVLEPEVPLENVFAFFEACDEPWTAG